MKTIVVPTDFSPISLNAVNYAAEMARSLNAELSLLHICLLPITMYGKVPYPAESMDTHMSDAEEKILGIRNNIWKKTDGKVKIDVEVRMAATVYSELTNFCKSKKPYAVVMGTQGNTAMERIFFGSNTIMAMRHLGWPLIVVPPEAKFPKIKKIGLACDFKNVDQTVPFSEIRDVVTQFNAELHVLHINGGDEKKFTIDKAIEVKPLQNMLGDLHPLYRFLDYEDIENGLEEFAEVNKLDLLIILPKRYNVIDKIFHQGHSKRMMLHTQLPFTSNIRNAETMRAI